jgi:hypothetical protein
LNRISKNSKKKSLLDEIDARLEAFENRYPEVVDPDLKKGETDLQREYRFAALREARRQDRIEHPEKYPPSMNWWSLSDHTTHCYYMPRDTPTEEEVEFYRMISKSSGEDFQNLDRYHFHLQSTLDAYNTWLLDDINRWHDWEKLGHIHDGDDLQKWMSHSDNEHHLHKEPPPLSWCHFKKSS